MNNIGKTTIVLMIVTIIAKILGFGRELVLASVYGVSLYSDAYLVALNIPAVIFSAIGGALATTFIPLYFECSNVNGESRALEFANNVFNIVTIISIFLAGIGLIFTEPIVKVFAMGFDGEVLKIAINFTRILILGIMFIGLSNIMTSYLQIKNNFIIPGIISIPYNIIIIISIVLSIKFGPYMMVWGTLIGTISQFLFQFPFASKYGYKYKLFINVKDKYLRKTMHLLGPVFIGFAVNQINMMVDKTLASTLIEGSISALNYASKLNGVIMALFITSIVSVIYPMLSKLSSENKKEEFISSVVLSINSVILLVIPISVGAIALSYPIVKILFQRGAFDDKATSMTAIALGFYSIGMVSFGLRDVIGKVFYSLQDTKTPMINGAIAMILNIIMNIFLVKIMGHAGLALATSISAIICTFFLFNSLKKRIGYFGQDKILKATIKSLIAAIIMGFVTIFSYNNLSKVLDIGVINDIISLVISIGIGAFVYLVIVIILKVEEISFIKDLIRKRIII